MEKSVEENNNIYFDKSRCNIDKAIYTTDYKKAFGLLILVLECLDNEQQKELIHYYIKNIKHMGIL